MKKKVLANLYSIEKQWYPFISIYNVNKFYFSYLWRNLGNLGIDSKREITLSKPSLIQNYQTGEENTKTYRRCDVSKPDPGVPDSNI